MSTIYSDEHSAQAVCEERARAADGDGVERRAVGVLHLNRTTPEKQGRVCEQSGMEGSEASRNAAETNSLDRSSCQQRNRCDMHCVSLSIAARIARFVHHRRTRTCSATGSCCFVQFLGSPRGKRPGPR